MIQEAPKDRIIMVREGWGTIGSLRLLNYEGVMSWRFIPEGGHHPSEELREIADILDRHNALEQQGKEPGPLKSYD